MKLRVILTAVPVLALLGCGSDSGMFTLSTGTYVFSNTNAVAPDNCNLGMVFRDGSTVQIAVSGANATFAFGSVDPTKNPVATISGNSINQGSKTFDIDNNTLPVGQRFDCVETITEAVSGSLVANDQAQMTLTYNSIRKSGAACTTQNLPYKVYPCASTLTFIGKKQ